MIRCPNPAHPDATPSCSVRWYPDGVGFRCFACGATGDIFDLVALAKGMPSATFSDKLRLAQELVEALPHDSSLPNPALPAGAPAHGNRAGHQVVAEVLLELCPLTDSSAAGDYLAGRGVLNEALADGWGTLPTEEEELERLVDDLYGACGEALVESCCIVRDGQVVHADHRVLIPFRGPDGAVDVLQRRLAGEGDEQGAKYVFPPGLVPRWPYGIEQAQRAHNTWPLVFVEGAIDFLAARALARQRGLNRVLLGIPSASLWRPAWATLGAGRDVAVAVDADAAGHRVAAAMRRDLLAAGAACVERWLPAGANDWAELWRSCAAR